MLNRFYQNFCNGKATKEAVTAIEKEYTKSLELLDNQYGVL